MKKIITIYTLMLLVSCNSKETKTSVFWVSGFKTSCHKGTGKSTCLLISKSESLDHHWELFYDHIEGFEFEEGLLQKVEITEQPVSEGEVIADKSSINYTLVSVIETKPDHRNLLQSQWQLESINGEILNDSIKAPLLQINLADMRLSGNAGCNNYTGTISKLGRQNLSITNMANTMKLCPETTYEDEYLNLLNLVQSYKMDATKLYFTDNDGKTILTYSKYSGTENKVRIHDIWTAVRIEGHPINRMVNVPRLEFNTTEMKVYGNDGCNDYFGTISALSNSNISLENIGNTRKMCPNMEIPQRYMTALKKGSQYKFNDDLLIISDKDEKEVLAFMKTD